MKWQEITVATTEEASEAVANLFYEVGAAGVVIQDPGDAARFLSESNLDACELPVELAGAGQVLVKAYLPINDDLVNHLAFLQSTLAGFGDYFADHPTNLTLAEVAEEDWDNAWKIHFHPEKIGSKIVVAPTWEPYAPADGEILVLLDPGMAFGTGNHPTTSMCIKAMEKYVAPGDRVYDVGTGSGILAVAAAKLGARSVLAIDIDAQAVEVARNNIAVNGIRDTVQVVTGDLLAGIPEGANLVTANIVANVVIALAPQAYRCIESGGYFLASGIIRSRLAEVERAVLDEGFTLVEVIREGEWVALVGQKE